MSDEKQTQMPDRRRKRRWIVALITALLLPIIIPACLLAGFFIRQEIRVQFPTRGTDCQHLKAYFPGLAGIQSCEWSDGLKRAESIGTVYLHGISGTARLSKAGTENLLNQYHWDVLGDENEVSMPNDVAALIPPGPQEWYIGASHGLLQKGYTGQLMLEKRHGLLVFTVIEDKLHR